MNTPYALYRALKSVNVSEDMAKAVQTAWEADIEKLTLKSDTQLIEANTQSQIKQIEIKIISSIPDHLEKLWSSLFKIQTKIDIVFPPVVLLTLFICVYSLFKQFS